MLNAEATLVNKLPLISSTLGNCLYSSQFQGRHNRHFVVDASRATVTLADGAGAS